MRPWGLRGDVKVESLTDFSERFEVGSRLWVGGVHRTIQHSRSHKGDIYLLSGIQPGNAARPDRDRRERTATAARGRLLSLRASVRTVEGETSRALPGGNAVHGDRGEICCPSSTR
ncbi:MAG: hypothetical protein U0531_08920 [Dehalococcoidia bacterium]